MIAKPNIIEGLLSFNKYSRPGIDLRGVRKIAIHYVGEPGVSKEERRSYFERLIDGEKNSRGEFIYASSHYICDDYGILQCIPLDEIAYSTGTANAYSISIENCHPDSSGQFSYATNNQLISLCAYLCELYNLDPRLDLIRHYDVNGEMCPLYYVNHSGAWEQLKQDVYTYMQNNSLKITQTPILLAGVDKVVDTINIGGYNFMKLRDLACGEMTVGYNKIPIVQFTKHPCNIEALVADVKQNVVIRGEVQEIQIVLDDKLTSVSAVNLEGNFYVKLRDLGCNYLSIGYAGKPVLSF